MSSLTLYPSTVSGVWQAMPSKSMAHRVLYASLLAGGTTRIHCAPQSVDMLATADVIARAGAAVTRREDGWVVTGRPASTFTSSEGSHGFQPRTVDVHPGESGTTLRYGMSILAGLGIPALWHCEPGLKKRPLYPLDECLRSRGIAVEALEDGWQVGAWSRNPPVRQEMPSMKGETVTISGGVSSQFIGGLMMALGTRPGVHTLVVTPPFESQPYVAMTMDVMQAFGVKVVRLPGDTFEIVGKSSWDTPGDVTIEGDWSNSALAFVVGAIARAGALTVSGLNPESLQGDMAIVSVLRRMGANIVETQEGYGVRPSVLQGCHVDCTHTPDLVPVLAIACACAQGTSVITGARRLRLKESDRLASVSDLLSRLGVTHTVLEDGLAIEGLGFSSVDASFAPTTATFTSYGDHRLVMALLAASTRFTNPVTLLGAESIAKSYPHLWDDWTRLGGVVAPAGEPAGEPTCEHKGD